MSNSVNLQWDMPSEPIANYYVSIVIMFVVKFLFPLFSHNATATLNFCKFYECYAVYLFTLMFTCCKKIVTMYTYIAELDACQ